MTEVAPVKPEKPPAEIKVEDLATLVAAISRFLTRLSKLPAFEHAGLGLAEWSALSIIWTPFPAEAGLRVLKGVCTAALVISAAAIIASRSVGADALILG